MKQKSQRKGEFSFPIPTHRQVRWKCINYGGRQQYKGGGKGSPVPESQIRNQTPINSVRVFALSCSPCFPTDFLEHLPKGSGRRKNNRFSVTPVSPGTG